MLPAITTLDSGTTLQNNNQIKGVKIKGVLSTSRVVLF
jgi:hypothetical protein